MFSRSEPPPDEHEHDLHPEDLSRWSRIREWFRSYSIYLAIATLLVAFIVVLLSSRIIYNIHTGERGVRWARFGGGTVLDRDYPEGLRLLPPWDLMYVYNVRIQEAHDTIQVLASNGLPITLSYSVQYNPDLNKVPQLHQTYGPDYVNIMVKPEVVSALREVIGNYRPEEIYARDERGLLQEIYDALAAQLIDRYVTIQALLIKELRLTPELEGAINQKLVADQNALAYEYLLKREESERARKEIEAEGIKTFERISGISIIKWRGIEATEEIAKSPNAKVIVVGTGPGGLPVILSADK
jgi:regulator of protease activity HflC (stomatin/prohibitin superfamily)